MSQLNNDLLQALMARASVYRDDPRVAQGLQGLDTAQTDYDRAYRDYLPYEDDRVQYNTRQARGWLSGGIEGIFDAIAKHKGEPRRMEALEQAQLAARGVDRQQAELEAYLQQQEAIEAEAAERDKFNRQVGMWSDYGVSVPEARLRASGATIPKGPEQTTLVKNLLAAGVDPNSPQGRKIIQDSLTKGNVTTNIPGAPQGYYYNDPANPAAGLSTIPGGPAAQDLAESEDQDRSKKNNYRGTYKHQMEWVDKAVAAVSPHTTGILGKGLSSVPGTDRKALEGYIKTLQAAMGFDRLQQMRNESKTGGALGQVSNIELDLLTSSIVNLDPDQPPDVLVDNLNYLKQHYGNFLSALDGVMPPGYDKDGNPVAGQTPRDGGGEESWTDPVTGKTYIIRNGQLYEQ